jgi:hypothetical protein
LLINVFKIFSFNAKIVTKLEKERKKKKKKKKEITMHEVSGLGIG